MTGSNARQTINEWLLGVGLPTLDPALSDLDFANGLRRAIAERAGKTPELFDQAAPAAAWIEEMGASVGKMTSYMPR
jgi:hypothetical protein